ncbi:MAG: hypothetical protein A3B13_03580 [Candidatus Liptonbacteria bacterium RIFCSPLOWO2_01_FULL_45_15]|uniref:Uncharacterized protein n=1 Tax=Candidatus Liptonbacteria bacterium RIFCSPLOWO2_01_FULL_45_15 TaxID=1798649 RepID=A0A1G2CID5_9BACT|nr:MAG: hypothetical protein A3B13_03580 [Candidatus Liptonbacteria bacterium RIFCSPLOWO2_01_FULL_45_15]
MSTATHETNREIAIYYIATALGIPVADVSGELKIGQWARYITSSIHFRTGLDITVLDFGNVTAGDILKQL